MKEFNFEIGTVPEGWNFGDELHITNGEFKYGRTAAINRVPKTWEFVTNECLETIYQFDYVQRNKVQRWIRWFVDQSVTI